VHSRPRILRAIAFLLLLTTVGAVGFVWLEAMDWSDATYLSVVTISTVGFGDVVPVTPAGRFFTLGLVATGVGTALYLISVIAQDILEGRLRDFFHRSSP
jgi:voltage-gated potassium channel